MEWKAYCIVCRILHVNSTIIRVGEEILELMPPSSVVEVKSPWLLVSKLQGRGVASTLNQWVKSPTRLLVKKFKTKEQ